MRTKRIIATTVSAIVLAWLVAVSLSLHESVSELTVLGSGPIPSGFAVRPLPAEADQAQVQTAEESGTDAEDASTLREEVSAGLDEAWDCFRAEDFSCSRVNLNRLNGIRDLNGLESAQILYVAAALEAARGRREEAIRILRDQIPALADVSNEFQARMQGILAGIHFRDGHYREALDAVDGALELAPNDSLTQMRDRIITARSLRSRDRLGERSIDQENLILLNEVIE